jgi:sec-independent protein translocase protein TatC
MPKAHDEDFKEMELWEHLQELRARLIRAVCYVLLGLVVAWLCYRPLSELFFAPLSRVMKGQEQIKLIFRDFTGPFMLQLQVSLVAGLVIALPLVTLELWGFVAPGLTRTERRACMLIFPLSILFFFMGVACGYVIMEPSVSWFLMFLPPGFDLLQDPSHYLIFMVKMVVAFGVCFQLPMVLMGLCYVGLITTKTLKEQWKIAVFLCFVIGAVATPGGDPFSMLLMAAPLAVLYVASIFLCALVERFKAKQEKKALSYEPA